MPDVTAATRTQNLFLDLRALLTAHGEKFRDDGECGFLGLAFHPAATNRYFYVFYSVEKGGLSYERISRFTANSTDPTTANTASEVILIEQRDEDNNHNGGCLATVATVS